jgi:hypothetical protein
MAYTPLAKLDPDLLTAGESSIPRKSVSGSGITLTTGTLRLSYFTARKTEAVTAIRIMGTAAYSGGTPTLIKLAAFTVAADGTLTCVGVTANDTTLLSAGSTVYTKAFTAGFTKTAGTRYALGALVVTAFTGPNILGNAGVLAAEAATAPRICAIAGGQTDMPAVGGTVAPGVISDSSNNPYLAVA